MQTERIYQAQGWQVEWYGEWYIPGDYYYKEDKLTRLINANGWCTRDEYVQIDRDKKNQHVLYRNTDYRLNNLGIINFHQSWQQQDGYAALYSYQHDYLKLDHWLETKVSGHYQTQDGGAGSAPSAQAFYDSNAVISGKINSADEINLPAPFPSSSIPNYFDHLKVHFDTDSDGWILNKEYYGSGSAGRVYYPKGGYRTYLSLYNCTYAYLYDINGQVHGGYSFITSNIDMIYNDVYHTQAGIIPRHAHIGLFTPRQLLYSLSKIENLPDDHHALSWPNSFNTWHDVQWYTVDAGDTLISIANKMYGDKNGALTIAKINGLPSINHVLKAGHQLNIPPYVGMHNKAETHRPYHQFISIMSGSLMPNLVPTSPKEDDDDQFIGHLIKIIAVAVVIVCAPQLAGFALKAATLSTGLLATGTAVTGATIVTDAMATGVVAALGEAAVQGVAIGFGVQSQFSWNEVLETAVSAGVGIGMSEMKMALVQRALGVATSVTATQFIEMKAGLRDKFDVRAVGLQVAGQLTAAAIDMGINTLHLEGASATVANQTANTVTNTLLGNATYHMPFDVQNMMMNGIGATIGNELGSYVAQSFCPVPAHQNAESNTSLAQKIKQAEVIAHVELAKAGLTVSEKPLYGNESYQLSVANRTRLERWNITPNQHAQIKRYDKIHDTADFALNVISDLTKDTLGGKVIDYVRDVREDIRTLAYGENAQRRVVAGKLGKEVAIGVGIVATGGIVGEVAASLAPVVSRLGVFGVRGGVEGGVNWVARNHISRLRLQNQLGMEQASSIFTETWKLRPEIIGKSDVIIPGQDLSSPNLIQELTRLGGDISDWGKYATKSIPSPSGNFQMHFYHNSVTGETYYGMDYKAIFDHQGAWNLKPQPNFDYQSPRFNK